VASEVGAEPDRSAIQEALKLDRLLEESDDARHA
jgi:hypothetical protein